MEKIKVYHFHNGSGGGVLSVIKNLLQFSNDPYVENHIIHTVNKALIPNFIIEPILGAVTQQLFFYSSQNNFYYTCKQLAKLLPDNKAVIVAHDWIELGMASNLGLQNPVVQIVHGNYDYYYNLATKHSGVIDTFICISQKICNTLKTNLPERKDNIICAHFPVTDVTVIDKAYKALQIIYFVGNLKDNNKQFSTIIEIARELSDAPNDYFFTIAGGGITKEEFFECWPATMKKSVIFLGYQSNEAIISILPQMDIFLLPSINEGLPVSLVESMKAGLVPLITRWEGGVDELVTDGIAGFYFDINASSDYVKCLKKLNKNKILLREHSINCIKRANLLFNPQINVQKIESIFYNASSRLNSKKSLKVYGSRLDHPLIPNMITKLIRKRQ